MINNNEREAKQDGGNSTSTASTLPLVGAIFKRVKVPSFIHVNLDAVAHNISVLKKLSGPNTEIMGVVKGSAYGSGLMAVVDVLIDEGVKELSVATMSEAIYLRKQNVTLPITVLGNVLECELDDIKEHYLIPSLSWTNALSNVNKDTLIYPDGSRLKVAINLDTGMSRYGIQPQDLAQLITTLDELNVNIASLYTHFQSAITETDNNTKQLDIFIKATEPYKSRGIARHVAATTGCVQGLGTDLDFIRPGGAITGLSSGSDVTSATKFAECGFKPAFSVVARPTFYKQLPAGRSIGYDGTYTTSEPEWIANLTTGWSDGLSRRLSNFVGHVRSIMTGEVFPIVGRVSMDSITVRLSGPPNQDDAYLVISDDFHNDTSAVGLARKLDAAVYEMPGNWSTRLPRVFTRHGNIKQISHSLQYTC